jgi:hypothetical protein
MGANTWCCELPYHGCVSKECLDKICAADYSESIIELLAIYNVSDLSDFTFVDEPFVYLESSAFECGHIAFRIMNSTGDELFVVLGNCHNGYYSHGLESFCGEGEL